MFRWALYWIWWFTWRIVVTMVSVFTIQNIVHQEQEIWIETKPLVIGAILFVILIRIWSHPSPQKETK